MKFGLEASSSSSASESEHDDARVTIGSVRRPEPVIKHGADDDDSDAPVPLERLASRPIRKAPFRRRPPTAGLSNPTSSTSTLTCAQTASSTTTPAASPSNFLPRPIRTVAPPSVKSRKGKLVQFDSNSSDEDLDQSSWRRRDTRPDHLVDDDKEDNDQGDDQDDDGYSDSEEDEWPVGPIGSVGIGGWRRANGDISSAQGAKARSSRIAMSPDHHLKAYGGTDAFQIWDDRSKAISWASANRSFHLSLARSFSTSPTASRTDSTTSITNDISSIESRLSSLALQASAEKAALVKSFQTRNAALWNSIEASIREAEKEEGDKQRVLEENRRKRQEAERKAKEMREAEERKKKEEEERKVREGKERERKEAEERKRRQEEEEKRVKEQEERDRKLAVIAPPSGKGIEGSPQAEWERWTAVMTVPQSPEQRFFPPSQQIKTGVLPVVSQNPTYRKECFTAKRAITPKIGQLTASAEMTLRVINQLDQVLSSMRPPPGGPREPYRWTLNHLAKALVKQAETEVTARISTAYPLARVVIGLIVRSHEELGEVLMARLVKKCFWITGWWPPKQPGQTEEAHQKSLGHAPPSAGESLIQYASRMSGLIALYAAITQTSPLEAPQGPCPREQVAHVPPHFRLAAGWRWIVLILRVPLVGLQPTPQLLGSFLEIAGERLLEVYGRQFAKVLEVVLREGIREGKAGFSDKSVSSTVRLTLWLEEWEKKGKVEMTQGRKPDL
ncbi:BZ3500_MvSof-1268-A1-R1_Chr4-3g07230 [Microbotryum saponariae]|uniref:mRNA export factor GLE1 n=1 Tax=Microbotryum saponariae TaxID=289078 RepID=A0A2X0M4E0_9BASI|nr:BZ3500_MvSof-1268-A1-R1_Chr4-3g07230 [Microbotryum saponariae]SDA06893.1 BZ3501_MvSof-1269-A2-R1_Chr4-2g06939 [Microbotryum saponariae]